MEIRAPYFTPEKLRQEAENFLNSYNPSGEIPVPIERIIEFQFKMDIVPTPGLHRSLEADSYITHDLKEIRIDEFVCESRPGRYRFSLAHELGHRILHSEVYAQLDFHNIQQWKELMTNGIPEREHSFLEYHAHMFAGLVLVPPGNLAESYEKIQHTIKEHGVSLQDDSDFVRKVIADHLSGGFGVSSSVIAKRLRNDGHWD